MTKRTLKIAPDVLATELDETVTIFDPHGDRYFTLDGVAALIWCGIASGRAEDQIVAQMVSRYEVEATAAQRDLDIFSSELAAAGLVLID